MRSTTNILILNLAIADLLFVVFCIPFTASDYIYEDWQFGNFWCKFVSQLFPFEIRLFCVNLRQNSIRHAKSKFCSLPGSIHDFRHVSCECLHPGLHVDRSISRRGARNQQHFHQNRRERRFVSKLNSFLYSIILSSIK